MATSFTATGIRLEAVNSPTPGNPVRICTPTLAAGWYRLLVRFYSEFIFGTANSVSFILRQRIGHGLTSHFVKWHQYGDGTGGGAGLAQPDEWSSAFPVDFYGSALELYVAWNPNTGAPLPMNFDVDIQPLGGAVRQCTLSNLFAAVDFAKNEPAVLQLPFRIQPLTKRLIFAIAFNPGGIDAGEFNFYALPRASALANWHRLGHPYLPNYVRTKFDMVDRSDVCVVEIEPKVFDFVGYTITGFNIPNGAVDSLFPGTLRVFEMVDVP
jgi:hypothetical protein